MNMQSNIPPLPQRLRPEDVRADLRVIAALVEPGSRVLDVGCGDGLLLAYLAREKGVDGRGIELSQAGVNACVARGLSVVQGDADKDLADYPTNGYDYVILSQTLQATRKPYKVLKQMLRIGRRAIVSFPNFGHWRVRLSLLWRGRMPVTAALPQTWYETPNIHLCTIADFEDLCRAMGAVIERRVSVDAFGRRERIEAPGALANLFAEQGMFLLRNKD
jgi:methionine biosynthesis protein MetW